MTPGSPLNRIRAAALDAIVTVMREIFDVERCTLRLDVEGDTFPVLHESCVPPAHSLIGDRRVALRGQPVVEALLGGADQVVQPDTRAASNDPAFLRMLDLYDGMRAQIVTAVRRDGRLLGMISLHQLGRSRRWSAEETALALKAAELVARVIDEEARGGSERRRSAMTVRLRVDRRRSVLDEVSNSHNRIWPHLPPVAVVDPGEELTMDVRDGMDGRLSPSTTSGALHEVNLDSNHPLTGPVEIRGARVGDLLVVEPLAIEPKAFGATAVIPGFGLLGDLFERPFLVRWQIAGGVARSADLPGVAIRGRPFLGCVAVAPSVELLARAGAREAALAERGGFALPPLAARRRTGDRAVCIAGVAHDPAARERRQPRRAPGVRRQQVAPAGGRPRGDALDRRSALRPGRGRVLWHGHRGRRDGLLARLPAAPRGHALDAAFPGRRVLRAAGGRQAVVLHDDGHPACRRRRER